MRLPRCFWPPGETLFTLPQAKENLSSYFLFKISLASLKRKHLALALWLSSWPSIYRPLFVLLSLFHDCKRTIFEVTISCIRSHIVGVKGKYDDHWISQRSGLLSVWIGKTNQRYLISSLGREPWSIGHARWLMIQIVVSSNPGTWYLKLIFRYVVNWRLQILRT